MNEQTKRPLVVDGEAVSGKKIACGVCGGLARYSNVSCERGCLNGFVLYPLTHMVEHATRKVLAS